MVDFENSLRKSLDFFKSSYLEPSIGYGLMAGGKRLRPKIVLLLGESLGAIEADLDVLALALEWIHNYSLIHDDLPGMDNDDYRRGKETVHKKFGEATAILAGDGLLTSAASLLLNHSLSLEGTRLKNFLRASASLFKAAGVDGMIQGQMVDLHPDLDQEDYLKKTKELFKVAFTIPADLTQTPGPLRKSLEDLGLIFGSLYQSKDDKEDQDRNLAGVKEIKGLEDSFQRLEKELLQEGNFQEFMDFLKEVIYGKDQVSS